MSIADALAAFNDSRHGLLSAEPWSGRLDRLAQAAFRASEHLIVYGSLSPGGPNHHRLAHLDGRWERGWVEGERVAVGWGAELGYPALRWLPGGPRVTAHLLDARALATHWSWLDGFEGAAYRRILVPFYTDLGLHAVGYLYAIA